MDKNIHLAHILDRFFDSATVENEYNDILTRKKSVIRGSVMLNNRWNKVHLQKIIADVKSNEGATGRKYDVVQENEVDTLILRRPYRINPHGIYRKVMALEDSFAIISKTHRNVHHQGYKEILVHLRENWTFPIGFVHALIAACNVCKMVKNIQIEESLEAPMEKRIWRINFLCMATECHYIITPKFILICEDVESEFVILRPLKEKTTEDVSDQLLKVFLEFGSPKTISADSLVIMTTLGSALKEIKHKLHAQFNVEIEHNSKPERQNRDIINTLEKWIEEVEVSKYPIDCELGCHVVQWKLNSRLIVTSTGDEYTAFVPYNRFMKHKLNWDSWDTEVIMRKGVPKEKTTTDSKDASSSKVEKDAVKEPQTSKRKKTTKLSAANKKPK